MYTYIPRYCPPHGIGNDSPFKAEICRGPVGISLTYTGQTMAYVNQ